MTCLHSDIFQRVYYSAVIDNSDNQAQPDALCDGEAHVSPIYRDSASASSSTQTRPIDHDGSDNDDRDAKIGSTQRKTSPKILQKLLKEILERRKKWIGERVNVIT